MSAPVPPPATVPPPASSSPSPSDGDDEDDSVSGSSAGGGGKKRSSYYFFKSTPAHEAHKYMPTLLTPSGSAEPLSSSSAAASAPSPQPVAAVSPSPSPEPSGGSRWNAAGTWEEKDLSSWAQQRLTTLLSFPASASSSALSVTVTSVSGDATLVFTRGKKRVGYDLSITAEWKAKVKSSDEELKGGLELPSIDQTSEGEYEMVVTVKERGKAADDDVDAITRQVRHLKSQLSDRIKQFENELREQ